MLCVVVVLVVVGLIAPVVYRLNGVVVVAAGVGIFLGLVGLLSELLVLRLGLVVVLWTMLSNLHFGHGCLIAIAFGVVSVFAECSLVYALIFASAVAAIVKLFWF